MNGKEYIGKSLENRESLYPMETTSQNEQIDLAANLLGNTSMFNEAKSLILAPKEGLVQEEQGPKNLLITHSSNQALEQSPDLKRTNVDNESQKRAKQKIEDPDTNLDIIRNFIMGDNHEQTKLRKKVKIFEWKTQARKSGILSISS